MSSSSSVMTTKPDYWEKAVTHLMDRDRILKKIIPLYPEISLSSRGSAFLTLARAIVGQQISIKAADSIWRRFSEAVGAAFTSEAVCRLSIEQLRQVGLSQRKAEYLQDLALHFDKEWVHPQNWTDMEDEQIIAELLTIRGIGRWTAEMFLIFNLQRPDVLPLDDVGLLKAISRHYFSGEPVSRFEAREVSVAWQPWRTVGTWYLWRSLDTVAVHY